MKMLSVFVASALFISGCGKPTPIETVESLAANPEQLKTLRQQCKTDRAKLGDELCSRAAEATNRRFFGNGGAIQTPEKEVPQR